MENQELNEIADWFEEGILECDPKDGKCGRCDEVRENIAKLRALSQQVQGWISVEDRLPEVGKSWIVTNDKRVWEESLKPKYWNGSSIDTIITRWQPLPDKEV